MLSLFILVLGNGFLLTLIPIRGQLEGFAPEISGYLASAYFAGMLIGAVRINKIIEGVGHIRAFAFFASTISVLTLLQGLFVYPSAWIALRFLFGLSISGIFITVESWLLVKSSIKMRGVALSIYMTIFYSGQSIGQLLLGMVDPKTLIPFCVVVILASLSVLPLTITKTKAPIVEEHSVFSPKKLFKLSPLSLLGSLFAGLILGPIYGLLPVFAQKAEYSLSQISWVMGSIIFGGLIFQWPIGMLSDRMDRRKVLMIASICTALLALLVVVFPQMSYLRFLIFTIFLGGFCFVLYPLSVSHACDLVEAKDIVSTTGAVLVSYGVGSIIGPIVASYMMRLFGEVFLFYFISAIAGGLALICFSRIIKKVPVAPEEKVSFSNIPQTTPMASELDPRIQESLEKEEQ